MGIFSRKRHAADAAPAASAAIPSVLFPDYFVEILTAVGVPRTDENLDHLATRTAFVLGTQVAAYTAQADDAAAFLEFTDRFGQYRGRVRDRSDCDRMRAWIRSWDRQGRGVAETVLTKWRTMCLAPDGFLDGVRDVPPWTDASSAETDDTEAWMLAYKKNAR